MVSVRLERRSGPVELIRPDGAHGTLRQPGQPDRLIAGPAHVPDCLAEELRRLDPDDVYGEALAGWRRSPAAGRRRGEPRSSSDRSERRGESEA